MRLRHSIILFVVILLGVLFASQAFAREDPRSVNNNIIGIHVINESDLVNAAKLVNSTGGDWGYVTIVVTEGERDREKWQATFDRMRELHLIPIVRLATHVSNASWQKPREDGLHVWVEFLNSLHWVVQNRYIILFNEPNHAKEWGGELNPREYADISYKLANLLHDASDDFFVMPAGLDASANNSGETMDEAFFIKEMLAQKPNYFDQFDGWSSHSYPNPAFSGSPEGFGRGSVHTYLWELEYLKSLGVVKELPVAITETGWLHTSGTHPEARLSPDTVAQYYSRVFSNIWKDVHVFAVTPFLLNYQGAPFDSFSFTMPGGDSFYPAFSAVSQLPKTHGQPARHDSVLFLDTWQQALLTTQSFYNYEITIKNEGQSIINSSDFSVKFDENSTASTITFFPFDSIPPFHHSKLRFIIATGDIKATESARFHINRGDVPISQSFTLNYAILDRPSVTVNTTFFPDPKKTLTGKLLVYSEDQTVLVEIPVTIEKGSATIEKLPNLEQNKTYRFVLLIPGYLPKQSVTQTSEQVSLHFRALLPIDFNQDGKFSPTDIFGFISQPFQ